VISFDRSFNLAPRRKKIIRSISPFCLLLISTFHVRLSAFSFRNGSTPALPALCARTLRTIQEFPRPAFGR
jgi:hypothetical protein